VDNKTRDLEATALRKLLSDVDFSDVIELGCGTGKNTGWLAQKADLVIAIDFSEEMLNVARKKLNNMNIDFRHADIKNAWNFTERKVDVITCSLVLEHIQNIDFIFQQANRHLKADGFFYVGELHPFKQYEGSKARFETASGIFVLECFTHHMSEYIDIARANNFSCIFLTEWFDENDRATIPRVIAFLFQKKD
jgi:ubiquinone/menaquinone biosynthesis C-methylase UbiE